MKNNLCTLFIAASFLFFNFPFQLLSQDVEIWCEPDTITTHVLIYQTADSVLMEPQNKYIATYNDSLLKTSEYTLFWSKADQVFNDDTYNTFTYNELGLLETKTQFYFDIFGTNNFVPFARYTYQYDTLENLIQEIEEDWDNESEEFVNSHKTTYTYNEHGDQTSNMFYYWHLVNQTWVLSWGMQHSYVYDANFNILVDTISYVNETDIYVHLFTYYPNGNLHTEVISEYYNGVWRMIDSIVYLYDNNNNLTRWTRYEWNNDSLAFIDAGRLTYTYDDNNNRTSLVREIYNSQSHVWEVSSWNPKLVWTYDDNDNAILIESFWWNDNTNAWEYSLSGHVDLYYNNMQSGYEMFGLSGSIFNIHYVCKEETIGVKEVDKSTVLIYPNPAQDRVFISGITERSQLTIYDISGKLVLQQTVFSEQVVNVKNLNRGIYLINIRNNQQNITQKLVIGN